MAIYKFRRGKRPIIFFKHAARSRAAANTIGSAWIKAKARAHSHIVRDAARWKRNRHRQRVNANFIQWHGHNFAKFQQQRRQLGLLRWQNNQRNLNAWSGWVPNSQR